MEKNRDAQLQNVQESMKPLIVALDDFLGTESDVVGQERSQIWQDASGLYSNLKGFLGNLQIQRILDQERNK